MGFVLILIFSLIAAAALAFVCWPLWRRNEKGRHLLVGSIAAFTLAVAAGAYVFVGHPELALRSLEKPRETDVRALVSKLAWRMRQSPDDPRGWLILGRTYLALDDAGDAALAFKRAIASSPAAVRPLLMADYGMALSAAAGAVTPEAEAAFHESLAHDPKNVMARFYLGQAYAERRDTAHALAIWQGLLADTPANAPWRETLLDRIALLQGTTPQAPPNVVAMVQGLAERLKAHPDDPAGWLRLLKAYVVLGELEKARATLGEARKALAGDTANSAALEAEARDLHLEK
jgi:cytochrome c-type biogenesis protein CcmH